MISTAKSASTILKYYKCNDEPLKQLNPGFSDTNLHTEINTAAADKIKG